MYLPESYQGIVFSIKEHGDGTCSWTLHAPKHAKMPDIDTGVIVGGQNEAILAARKAISTYLLERQLQVKLSQTRQRRSRLVSEPQF